MSLQSSINFKKSKVNNTEHNDRTLPPSYLIDNEKGAECNRSAEQARELKNQIIEQAKANYAKSVRQKFQAKSYEWSAVCNIKSNTTMQDLEKLAQYFETKFGFQCYQIAIHRDEGYKNEAGEIVLNEHAHLEFITLDRQTGKQNFKMRNITREVLREIQTQTAEILQMTRGQDKRISGRQRVEPRIYGKQKEAEKQAMKEALAEFEEINQKINNQQYIGKLLKDLSVEKSAILEENFSKEKFEMFLQELLQKYKILFKIDYKTIVGELTRMILQQIEQIWALKAIVAIQEQKYAKNIQKYENQFEILKNSELEQLKFYEKERQKFNKKEQELSSWEADLQAEYDRKFEELQKQAEIEMKQVGLLMNYYETKYNKIEQSQVSKDIKQEKDAQIRREKQARERAERENEELKIKLKAKKEKEQKELELDSRILALKREFEAEKTKMQILQAQKEKIEQEKLVLQESFDELSKEFAKSQKRLAKAIKTMQRAEIMSFACECDADSMTFAEFAKLDDDMQEQIKERNIQTIKNNEETNAQETQYVPKNEDSDGIKP